MKSDDETAAQTTAATGVPDDEARNWAYSHKMLPLEDNLYAKDVKRDVHAPAHEIIRRHSQNGSFFMLKGI